MKATKSVFLFMYTYASYNFTNYHSLSNFFSETNNCSLVQYEEHSFPGNDTVPVITFNISSKLVTLETNSLETNWTATELKSILHTRWDLNGSIMLAIDIKFTNEFKGKTYVKQRLQCLSTLVLAFDDFYQTVWKNLVGERNFHVPRLFESLVKLNLGGNLSFGKKLQPIKVFECVRNEYADLKRHRPVLLLIAGLAMLFIIIAAVLINIMQIRKLYAVPPNQQADVYTTNAEQHRMNVYALVLKSFERP